MLVVTGGEPLLQEEALGKLLQWLPEWEVEIETNGTLPPPTWADRCQWNVSPKLANSGEPKEKRWHPEILRQFTGLDAIFKFVVQQESDLPEVEQYIREVPLPRERTYLMPEAANREDYLARRARVRHWARTLRVHFTGRYHLLVWGGEAGY